MKKQLPFFGALLLLLAFTLPSFADGPQIMTVSCAHPKPTAQHGLRRPIADGNLWAFEVQLGGDAQWASGPFWTYPGKNGGDPAWGQWHNGADGQSSVSWNNPQKSGDFHIGVTGKISCGGGGGGGGDRKLIDIKADWFGDVEAKEWKAEPAITGGEITAPDKNDDQNPYVTGPGETVSLAVSEATDNDTWTQGEESDQDEDTVNYKWTSGDGGFVTDNHPDGDATEAKERTAQWKAPEEPGDYTVTCEIDDEPAEVEDPDTGDRDDDAVTRTVHIKVEVGESSATLKLYKDAELTEEATGTIGGNVYVALEVKLGKYQKLVSNNATLRIEENYGQHSEAERQWDRSVSFANGWQKKDANDDWQPTQETPQTKNSSGDDQHFRKVWSWPTTSQPLGHNEQHTVEIVKVDDGEDTELSFTPTSEGDDGKDGPESLDADVKNMVFGTVNGKKVTTNATEDYFIFDEDSSNMSYQQPEFSFKIEDSGEPKEYYWEVYIEPTSQSENSGAFAFISGIAEAGETVNATWNGEPGNGLGSAPKMIPGTYAFDIYVQKLEDANNPNSLIEDMWLKSGNLFIGDHYLQINNNIEEDRKTEVGFELLSATSVAATEANVEVLNFEFSQVATKNLPTGIDNMYGPINVHQLDEDEDGIGWRAIFTAVDNDGINQRDHENKRAWAVNNKVYGRLIYWIDERTYQTEKLNQEYIKGAFLSSTGWAHDGIYIRIERVKLDPSTHKPTNAQIEWSQKQRFDRAAVVYEKAEIGNSIWAGLTTATNGNLNNPGMSRYSQDVIDNKSFLDTSQKREMAASNTALHELGHALGIPSSQHHSGTKPDPFCVMYDTLVAEHGNALGSSEVWTYFGGPTDMIVHYKTMRDFMGVRNFD